MNYKIAYFLLVLLLTSNTFANEFDVFINSFKSYEADFKQKVFSENGSLKQITEGEMSLMRPSLFLWHTKKPYEQILLINNNDIWLYDVDLDQATKQNKVSLNDTPLYWFIKNNKNLNTKKAKFNYSKDNLNWYQTFQKNDKFEKILFAFKEGMLMKMKLVYKLGFIIIELDNIKANKNVNLNKFKLNLSNDVDIIYQ